MHHSLGFFSTEGSRSDDRSNRIILRVVQFQLFHSSIEWLAIYILHLFLSTLFHIPCWEISILLLLKKTFHNHTNGIFEVYRWGVSAAFMFDLYYRSFFSSSHISDTRCVALRFSEIFCYFVSLLNYSFLYKEHEREFLYIHLTPGLTHVCIIKEYMFFVPSILLSIRDLPGDISHKSS